MVQEWLEEPDELDWVDEETGFRCAIRRPFHLGHLCGYVGIPDYHPQHGKSYDDFDVNVHGGLTYSDDRISGSPTETRWWLGFDCAHSGDLIPNYPTQDSSQVYRNIAYVEQECTDLAAQLFETLVKHFSNQEATKHD